MGLLELYNASIAGTFAPLAHDATVANTAGNSGRLTTDGKAFNWFKGGVEDSLVGGWSNNQLPLGTLPGVNSRSKFTGMANIATTTETDGAMGFYAAYRSSIPARTLLPLWNSTPEALRCESNRWQPNRGIPGPSNPLGYYKPGAAGMFRIPE